MAILALHYYIFNSSKCLSFMLSLSPTEITCCVNLVIVKPVAQLRPAPVNSLILLACECLLKLCLGSQMLL